MKDSERFHICQLIIRKIEGVLSPEELVFLHEELDKNPEALDIYVDLAIVHASLSKSPEGIARNLVTEPQTDDALRDMRFWQAMAEEERTAQTIELPQKTVPREPAAFIAPRRKKTLSRWEMGSLAAAAAAVVFMILFVRFAPDRYKPLGVLSRSIEAKWLDSTGSIADGCTLFAGPLHLTRGYAQIKTENGTSVILQAPVELELESESQLLLRRGQITVKVKPGQNHYVVRSLSASVIDFGTEFGVWVDEDNNTLTHVYEGQVEMRSGSEPLKADNVLKLGKGQGGQADTRGRLQTRVKLADRFVRSEEFEVKFTASHGGSAYQRWLAGSYELRRDPDLVLYYPFLKSDEPQDAIINYAMNTSELLNGTLGHTLGASTFTSPSWTSGRWPGKAALKFERDKRNCVWVDESPELDLAGNISLAVWVCCPEPHKGGHLFSNRAAKSINYQFGCFFQDDPYYPEKLQFLRSSDSSPGVYSSTPFHWTSDWTFLAVTHDGQTVRFYVNGELFEAIPFVSKGDAVSGNILFIGDVPAIGRTSFDYAAFNGLMDELAIFKRVLSAEEIQKMYQAGKP